LPDDWSSELDIIRSELLIQLKYDITENETFNYVIYNLKPKIYKITLAIVKREMNDPNYVPTIVSLKSNEIVAIESESPAVAKATEWKKQFFGSQI
jgi:hypothetical protein